MNTIMDAHACVGKTMKLTFHGMHYYNNIKAEIDLIAPFLILTWKIIKSGRTQQKHLENGKLANYSSIVYMAMKMGHLCLHAEEHTVPTQPPPPPKGLWVGGA